MVNTGQPDNIMAAHDDYQAMREKGRLDFATVQKLDGLFEAALPAAAATRAFNDFRQGGASIPTGPRADATAIFTRGMIPAESGGKQFAANGEPLTSKAKAIGISQMLLTTGPEAAKLAGIPWDESRLKTDAAYNQQLGQAFFSKLLRDFEEPTMAVMSYNAGPDRVREHIEKVGDPRLGQIPVDQFVATFPYKETRGYVAKVRSNLGESGMSMEAASAKAAQLDQETPGAGKLFLSQVNAQRTLEEKAKTDREELATSDAMQTLIDNGGNMGALTPAQRAAIPPNEMKSVLSLSDTLSKGAKIQTDWTVYYDLKTNPDKLAKQNLLLLRDKLSDADFQELTKDQVALAKDKKNSTNTSPLLGNKAVVDSLLAQGGVTNEGEKGKYYVFISRNINQQEEALGRKLNDEETWKVASKAFTVVKTNRPGWWNEQSATPVTLKPLIAGETIKIPAGELELVNAALKNKGIPVTTENQQYVYRKTLGIQ
jgi:hypothetical protein